MTTPGCNDILVFEEKKNSAIGMTGGIAHFGFRLRDPKDIDEIIDKIKKLAVQSLTKENFFQGRLMYFLKTLTAMK